MNYSNNTNICSTDLMLNYMALEFGGLICWNMGTFTNEEIATPDLALDTFAPSGLDIDDWLDTVVLAGMTYAVLTAKHHDGFCLWPTAFADPAHDPYSIAETTWYANNGSPDVLDLFLTGCRARNLKPCIYFSIWDSTHETRSGTNEYTGTAAYVEMIKTQLTELLTNYGEIYSIWFDGWWHGNLGQCISYKTIIDHVKAIQPNCLIINNWYGYESEIIEVAPEGGVTVPLGNESYMEEVMAVRDDGHWFYNSTDGQNASDFMTKTEINARRAYDNTNNANYLLGITVGTDGHIPAAEKTILDSLQT